MELFWKRLLLTVGVAALFFCMVEGSSGHRQKFGENCSKNKKCDFTKWLRCGKEGKCICFQNDPTGRPNLYYDPQAERCVGVSGANCSQKFYPFDDVENAHFFHMRGATTNHWRYGNGSLRCGANAFCDGNVKNYICNCRMNYYEADDGKCYKLKSYGDSCVSKKECDPDAFLSCKMGTCMCEKENHLYDSNLNKCVVLAGLPCEVRYNRLDRRSIDDCTSESFCEENSGVCRCNYGTQIHSDRTCQRGYNQECDHDHPCGDSKLSCRSKVCQCKYPLHMKYDEASGQCAGIASGPCVYNDTSELTIQCTQNAECVQRGKFSECKCQPGFLQTIEGDCVKVYGSLCEVDADCDRVGPLACINAHCECPDLLLSYDPKTRRCKGLVGSRCKMDEDSCIEHATCFKFEEVSGGNVGRCLCDRGYKETENRTCAN